MAEWATNDLRTAALSNQKNMYVMDSAPTTLYEGQVWVCTSSDPPLVKVYDLTNTQWMDYHPTYYETVVSGQEPAVTPTKDGTLAVIYDTDQSITTLYARSNAAWQGLQASSTVADWREAQLDDIINANGGSDTTISSNTTISGFVTYNDLTINSGITLTLGADLAGICARDVKVDGTITKATTGGAGGAGDAPKGGDGGNGGGQLFLVCRKLDNNGTIQANGVNGVNAGTSPSNTFSSNEHGGSTTIARTSGYTVGTGGDGGTAQGGTGNHGGGGGGTDVQTAANGGSVTYQTFGSFDGLDAFIRGAFFGESPYEYAGSGGGEGAQRVGDGVGGGGGGGGGVIYISCSEFDNNGGTIAANAGIGGDGDAEGVNDAGGGGGGGGIVYVLCETVTTSGTITVTQGAGGTGDANGISGSLGTYVIADVY